MSAPEAAEPNAAAVPVPRRIPGLSVPSTAPQQAPKPRKRSSKNKVPLTGTVEASSPSGAQDSTLDKREAAIAEVPVEDDDLVVEEKKTSAVEACHKRIRATTKKLQRIEGYEASVGTLNADQQRAIQGKPALEAVARELNELLVILKAEEAQDEERNKRVAAVEEKKQSRAIDAAVQVAKTESQQHLSLLFQFLHLHALYHPAESAFAPPILPPVVANATGSDVAVVRMLFDAFSNGPLLGADDGALERLAKIFDARDEEVLPGTGVTYGRVRELIHGMTAPPEDVRAAPESSDALANETVEDLVAQSNEPAGKADSVVALVDGATEAVHPPVPQSSAPPQPSFMQPSEVEVGTAPQDVATPPADEKVQHWAQDIALEAQAPPPSGPSTPAPDASFGRNTPSTSVPTTPTSIAAPPIAPNGFAHLEQPRPQAHQQSQPTLDWAAEDDGDGGLPHLDELAPPVPVVSLPAPSSTAAQAGTPAGSSDGFQPARQPRRAGGGGQGGAPRGGHRGGRGGSFFRGARRGGPGGPGGEGRSESFQQREGAPQQEGAPPQQQGRGPRPPRFEHRGESGAGNGEGKPHGAGPARGRGRGGGGRGRGGRGGANGGAPQGAGAATGGAAAGQSAPAASA
ncbi:hypothetical protein JCM9279_001491 [Rhodotorula babjevae]